MRVATLTGLLVVVLGNATIAQLTLQPLFGLENTRTTIDYNNIRSFSPLGSVFSPQAALRLDYKFKKGHGPYVGMSTTRLNTSFSFPEAENGVNNYTANLGDYQFQLEGGYQYSSKKIALGKAKQPAAKTQATPKKSCGSYSAYSSRCSKNYNSIANRYAYPQKVTETPKASKNNVAWMRIIPSLGMAYVPGGKNSLTQKVDGGQTSYEYIAANSNLALLAGTGFEFGRGNRRNFTLSFNYFKGLGSLNNETVTQIDGNKISSATLNSDASGWNLRLGVPISLGKTKSVKEVKQVKQVNQAKEVKKPQQKSIYKIRYRCGKAS